jgi:two-component system, OmpR family, response regulator NblR
MDLDATLHRVLVVVSDAELVKSICKDLKQLGYLPFSAAGIVEAIQQVGQYEPDLILIDVKLQGESGIRLCEQLRGMKVTAPLLLLMAQDNVEDRVACLESGADDYLLKPYRIDELITRMQLFLKRDSMVSQEQVRFDDLSLDVSGRRVFRGGKAIDLTVKEFELLRFLMDHPGEVLTREQILENVWGYDFMGESNVIEVYIRYLRLKLEEGGGKRLIQTVRGVGYVLREF